MGSLRDRAVACSVSDHQGANLESCVWRTVSSHSSHSPQEVILAHFSLYVHKEGLKPHSFSLGPVLARVSVSLLVGYLVVAGYITVCNVSVPEKMLRVPIHCRLFLSHSYGAF